jgi:hypothetical protein
MQLNFFFSHIAQKKELTSQPKIHTFVRLGMNMNIQGGALNRGLFFAGPSPLPLGAVSGDISENRWAAVQMMA